MVHYKEDKLELNTRKCCQHESNCLRKNWRLVVHGKVLYDLTCGLAWSQLVLRRKGNREQTMKRRPSSCAGGAPRSKEGSGAVGRGVPCPGCGARRGTLGHRCWSGGPTGGRTLANFRREQPTVQNCQKNWNPLIVLSFMEILSRFPILFASSCLTLRESFSSFLFISHMFSTLRL